MRDAQAVFLDGTLHVGGGITEGSYRHDAKLYSCKPGNDGSWTETDTPTYYYALAIYVSHLVLVGGNEYPSEQTICTNKIYTMIDGEFQQTLPTMIKKRHGSSAVSSGSILAVAGGSGDLQLLSSVEVFKNGMWTMGQPLPAACYSMKSVSNGVHWYLTGGRGQERKLYRISLESLVAGATPLTGASFVWLESSAVALFGGHILCIGGEDVTYASSSDIYAYSPMRKEWMCAAELPTPLANTSAIVLPSGELMVIGGFDDKSGCMRCVFRSATKSELYIPMIMHDTH